MDGSRCRLCQATSCVGDAPLKRCSSCKAAFYCSRACQSTDWSNHRTACAAVGAASTGPGVAGEPSAGAAGITGMVGRTTAPMPAQSSGVRDGAAGDLNDGSDDVRSDTLPEYYMRSGCGEIFILTDDELGALTGPQRQLVQASYGRLSAAFKIKDRGDFRLCVDTLQSLLSELEASLGTKHIGVAPTMRLLADVYQLMDLNDESFPYVLKSLKLVEDARGTDSPLTAKYLRTLVGTQLGVGHHSEALRNARRSLRIMEEAHGPDSVVTADYVTLVCGAARAMGDSASAITSMRRVCAIEARHYGAGDPRTYEGGLTLALFLTEAGELSEADEIYRAMMPRVELAYGRDIVWARAADQYVQLLTQMGRFPEAKAMAIQGIAAARAIHGNDHGDVFSALLITPSSSLPSESMLPPRGTSTPVPHILSERTGRDTQSR